MKTIWAKEKSEYVNLLWECVEMASSSAQYKRLQEIERVVKSKGDELITIVTTKNTHHNRKFTPPMSKEDYSK